MTKLLFLVTAVSCLIVVPVFAHEPGVMGPGMMGCGFGMGWPGFFLMFAFWIVVIVAVVLLIRWLITSTGSGSRAKVLDDSAIEILKKRYARGEINKEEFEERKKDLEK